MEAIIAAFLEAFTAIICFIAEVIILILKLLIAMFSSVKRKQIKNQWSDSRRDRIEIILSGVFLLACLGILLYFFLKVSYPQDDKHQAPASSTEPGIKGVLKEKAKDYLKEKWKEKIQ